MSETRIRVKEPKAAPTKADLIQLAADVYKLALDNERVYTNKEGKESKVPQPDFRAALDAVRLLGEMTGHLGKWGNKAEKELEEEEAQGNAEVALKKLRSRLVQDDK